jgi:hypothetical protein
VLDGTAETRAFYRNDFGWIIDPTYSLFILYFCRRASPVVAKYGEEGRFFDLSVSLNKITMPKQSLSVEM